jgi:hypothetical protein
MNEPAIVSKTPPFGRRFTLPIVAMQNNLLPAV